MNSTADDIRELLEADSSLGLTFAENLFIGKEPATPDNCVTIYDTPGYGPLVTLDGANNYFFSSFQIIVRNRSYPAGYNMIHSLVIALHGRGNETVGDTTYLSILCSSDTGFLDWDENNRAHFSTNFNVQRRTQ